MSTFVAVIALLMIIISVPLIFTKPAAVFYLYLVATLFSGIISGYILQAGKLGLPRTWSPADFLAVWTFFATFFIHREKVFNPTFIEKCLIILGAISVFSLMQGFIFHSSTVVAHSRVVFFVPSIFFSIKYFITRERVQTFLTFAAFLLLFMFFLHVLIRFGLYTPPSLDAAVVIQRYGALAGERGTRYVIPMLYLVLISIGIGRLSSKNGNILFSSVILITGIGGVILAEGRSTYGATAIIILFSILFVRNKLKMITFYSIAGFLAIFLATAIGFDFLARFRAESGSDRMTLGLKESSEGWRGQEPGLVAENYKREPFFVITGRGIGALHYAPSRKTGKAEYVSSYHSEYIGWLDRCGLIGFVTVILMFLAGLWRSLILARDKNKYIGYFGTVAFLSLISLMAEGIFHPILSHVQGAAFIIPFFVIISNSKYISWYDSYQQFDDLQQYQYDDWTEVNSYEENVYVEQF